MLVPPLEVSPDGIGWVRWSSNCKLQYRKKERPPRGEPKLTPSIEAAKAAGRAGVRLERLGADVLKTCRGAAKAFFID
jgi:hypothetical protein